MVKRIRLINLFLEILHDFIQQYFGVNVIRQTKELSPWCPSGTIVLAYKQIYINVKNYKADSYFWVFVTHTDLLRNALPKALSLRKGFFGSTTRAFPGIRPSMSPCITAINESVVGSGPIRIPGKSCSSRYLWREASCLYVFTYIIYSILIKGHYPSAGKRQNQLNFGQHCEIQASRQPFV